MTGANIEFFLNGSTLKIKINGDIDHHSAKRARESIDAQIKSKKPLLIILELDSVDFMDSSGLGLILGRYNLACEIGASIILSRPSRRIKRILELAGIERIMKIEGDGDNEAC